MLHDVTAALARAHRVLLTAPSELDADAIGALEALRRLLPARWPHLEVRIVIDEPVPPSLGFLCPIEHFADAATTPVTPADVAVVVDGDPARLQASAAHVAQATTTIMIDHHRTSATSPVQLRLFDPAAASTTTLVLLLADHWGVPLDPPTATAIYAGIAFDTGTFRYRNTSPATHRAAARLLEAGVDHAPLIERILLEQGEEKARLRGQVLTGLRKAAGGRAAWATLRAAECRGANTGGLVDELVFLRGVEVGLLITERGDGKVRVSLRARGGIDVAAIAQQLAPGGGGHAQAAGAVIVGRLRMVEQAALAAVEAAFSAAPPR